MYKVLVCGDRDWEDEPWIFRILDQILALRPYIEIIEGEARGADKMARRWAELNGRPFHPFPADWDQFGKSAGPIRNRQMLKEGQPDLVLAFYDHIELSRGTKDMIEATEKVGGIPFIIYSH